MKYIMISKKMPECGISAREIPLKSNIKYPIFMQKFNILLRKILLHMYMMFK